MVIFNKRLTLGRAEKKVPDKLIQVPYESMKSAMDFLAVSGSEISPG